MSGLAWTRNTHPYTEVINYLKSENIKCVYADYPDAYRLALISGETVVASSTHLPRIQRYEACAKEQSPRIVVLHNENEELPMFLSFNVRNALKFKVRRKIGEFTILESVVRTTPVGYRPNY